jgi:sulfide:quinone oxidoreductase
MKRIVILGAGAAGTMMANKLTRGLPDDGWHVTVLDRDNVHVYQPGLLLLPFGTYRADQIVKPRRGLLDGRIEVHLGGVDHVAPDENRVYLSGGERVPYDILVVATGARIRPEQTPGLTGAGWQQTAFDFYTLEGARALGEKLATWKGGRFVVNVVDLPIKCPVAPLELLFLADAYFTQQGRRDDVQLVYATPLAGAFSRPRAAAVLGELLAQRGVEVVPDFSTAEVDGAMGVLEGYDGRKVGYDLLVSVPRHGGADVIVRSGLGDENGFVPTHPRTLQSERLPNVFVLGDASDLPSPKAATVAHFQSEVLLANIHRFIKGRDLDPGCDGHATCFLETGHGQAMLLDFNDETEPLPGRYPLPGLGPFTLLEESAANHWGKLAFKWAYWNVLLAGQPLVLDHRLLMAGKWS